MAFQDHLTYLEEYRVLVCNVCHHGVWQKGVRDHFDRKHSHLPTKLRGDLHTAANELRQIATTDDEIIVPSCAIVPIPQLHLQKDAFRCLHPGCTYICRTLTRIKQHAASKHGWVNCQRKGGDVRALSKEPSNKIWASGRACQQFFPRGSANATRSFEVILPPDQLATFSSSVVEHLDEMRKKVVDDKAAQSVSEDFARYSTDNWLRFNKFKTHHRGLEPAKLREMVRLPDSISKAHIAQSGHRTQRLNQNPEEQTSIEEEDFITDCCQAIEELIWTAKGICKDSVVGEPALRYLVHRETEVHCRSDKIMYSDLTQSAMIAYIGRYMRMTSYILRTYKLAEQERPGYMLSKQQEDGIQRLHKFWSTKAIQDKAVFKKGMVRRCLRLWMHLIDRTVKDQPFDSAMYSAVSMLGISNSLNTETQDFYLPANRYSPVIASVVTVVRMLVLYSAYLLHTADVKRVRTENPGLSNQDVIMKATGVKDEVKKMVDGFLVWNGETGDTSHTMYSVQALKAQARKMGAEIKGGGHTHWVKMPDPVLGGGVININSKDLDLVMLGEMLQACYYRLRRQLERDLLMLAGEPPTLDIGQLVDNPAVVSKTDWSFLRDERNRALLTIDGVAGENWLFSRLLTEEGMQIRFGRVTDLRSTTDWEDSGVAAYLDAVKSFKEQLLVLVHLTAGAPARGNEILSVEHRNSPENPDGRNIFVENGLVAFAPNWSKTSGHTGKRNAVHRYVPQEVSKLVVYFLWLVQPFVEVIQLSYLKQTQLSSYFWEAKYGHVAVDAADYLAGAEEESGDEPDLADSNPRTTKRQARALNPDGLYNSDKLRRLMHAEFERFGLPQIGIQDWRHAYPAIQRTVARNTVVANTLDVLYENAQPLANFHARASGHTERTEANIYGRDIHEGLRHTPDDRARYRAVSADWHLFLKFPSTLDARNPDMGLKGLMTERERVVARERARWLSMANADMLQELRIFTQNPKAEFRPGQEEVLQAIFQGRPRILAIMATGAGKASLFTLPAMHPQAGTTVVVVPTTALKLDFMQRTLPTGLECAMYDGIDDELPYGAKLVFVTPEGAMSDNFKSYLESLRALGQLDRVVIDECHVVLDSMDDRQWRPKMLELAELQGKRTQLVYLTGSLGPQDMSAFYEAIRLGKGDLTVFRHSTSRSNISYNVQGVLIEDGQDDDEATASHIMTEMSKQARSDQAIVYCMDIKRGESLAERLATAMYHGQLAKRKQARLLAAFTRGEMQIIVATNAMGQGVDLKAVKTVFHVGARRMLRDFVQESGRAGRDGQSASRSIILMHERRRPWGVQRAKPARQTEEAMVEFVQTRDHCRRKVLDMAMDGEERPAGCTEDEEQCDICRTLVNNVAPLLEETLGNDKETLDEYETPRIDRERTTEAAWTSLPSPISLKRSLPAVGSRIQLARVDMDSSPIPRGSRMDKLPASSSARITDQTDQLDSVISVSSPSKRQRVEQESQEFGSSQLDLDELARINDRLAMQQVQDKRKQHTHQRSFEQTIAVWHRCCPICLVIDSEERQHNWAECPSRAKEIKQVEEYAAMFKRPDKFKLANWAGCFHCYLPLELCQSRDQTTDRHGRVYFEKSQRPCQYPDTVRLAIAAILLFGDSTFQQQIRSQAGLKGRGSVGMVEVADWLARRLDLGRFKHCSRLCHVLFQYDKGGI